MISIKHKLVFSHSMVMLLVAAVSIGVLSTMMYQHFQDMLNDRADAMARSFSADYAELLSLNTSEKAINFTSELHSIPDVVSLFLYRLDGEQLFSYHRPPSVSDKEHKNNNSLPISTQEYLKPVTFSNKQIGSIRVALSENQVQIAKTGFIQLIVILGIGILSLTILLSLWVQKLMADPVVKLARLTREIADSGSYSRRIQARSKDEIGALYQSFNRLLDATEKAESELIQEKERMNATLNSLAEGVITTDEMGMVQYLNPVAEDLLGTNIGSAAGQSIDSLISIIPKGQLRSIENPIDDAISQNQVIVEQDNCQMFCHLTGKEIEIDYSAAPIRNKQQVAEGAVFIFRDVGKSNELARQLSSRSRHDVLTGFYNRGYFETLIDDALDECRKDHVQHALFYVDLDRFKVVNESHGFVAGDGLMRSIAGMLVDILDKDAILARIGSDEFGILIKNCDTEQAKKIAEDLVSYIGNYPYIWDQKELSVKASVGVVYVNKDSSSALKLLANAGMACMAAKEKGGDREHFYQPDDLNMARRMNELRWVEKIKIALQEDKFELYYQPMIPLNCSKEDRPIFEILIRYLNNSGELIGPGKFLPAAEKYGLMPEVDRWVIQALIAACKPDASEFGNLFNSTSDFLVSVNLSGQSVDDDTFLQFIEDLFELHDVDPAKFCFEITETAAISNLSKAHKFIQQMRSLGCKFALDDFGSGMSSFSYLKNLPVDYLKIDGSFVRDIAKIPADFEMVKAVNQIGKALNMQTIAEFVEDEQTSLLLTEIGVNYGQGYYYAIPNPLSIAPEIYCLPTPIKNNLS